MPSKRININNIPLGATAINGKTVGFDALTRQRKYITVSKASKPTFLYVPNPMGNHRKSMMGWLLTIMRNTPMKPGFDYQKLVPTSTELAFLNKIKKRSNVLMARLGRPKSASDMFKHGSEQLAILSALAATYQ